VRAQLNRILSLAAAAAFALLLLIPAFEMASSAVAAGAPLAALCQVVYPLDQFPGAKDYHYTFFGNAFFINEDGYLLTASHVLSAFREGGQPHIIVGAPNEPRHLLSAPLVAADWVHDVAILKATPNPISVGGKIAYLPLSVDAPPKGKAVVEASLLSSDVENASSLDEPLEGVSQGEVLDYQFHHEIGVGDSEVLLVSQQVAPGQSGSPLVSADSQGVVGIIIGRWLLPLVMPLAPNRTHVALSPGAALRIHYAINLLEKNHIAWHAADEPTRASEPAPAEEVGFAPPVPVFDALIDSSGKPIDVRVVAGDGPFLEPALSAVRTWSFKPARQDGRPVEARIGIVFQFPQSFVPPQASKERKHEEALDDSDDRSALPVVTIEPNYPVNSVAQGSVGLYNLVDAEGHVTSTSTLLDVGSLTAPTAAVVRQWHFAPAKLAGIPTESAVIVVETFRRPTL
jgi:hypothetical protein